MQKLFCDICESEIVVKTRAIYQLTLGRTEPSVTPLFVAEICDTCAERIRTLLVTFRANKGKA